jgi:hypothetical protein
MEYWETKVKNLATCCICLKILNYPLKLPCLTLVCQVHIQEIQKVGGHVINCPSCKNTHNFDDLKKCDILSNSLDQIFGADKNKKLLKLESLIEELDLKGDEVSLAKNTLECYIYDHLKQIQNQIDLEREELKLKIDNEHNFFTNKIEELIGLLNESTSQVKLNECNREYLYDLFRKISRDHKLNINHNDQIDQFKIRFEKEMKEMDSKLIEFQNIKDQTSLLYFDNNFLSKADESILGSIKIKQILLENSLNLITFDHTRLSIWDAKSGELIILSNKKFSFISIRKILGYFYA